MMIELLIILIIVDVFLILRFVQPELVYTLREQLGPVASNRLLLDALARKDTNPTRTRRYQRLFSQDHRGELRIYTGPIVRTRLMKNRARLRSIESTLDARDNGQTNPEGRDVAECLEELSDLLNGVSRRLQPTGEYVHNLVDAPRLLRTIYDWQRDQPATGERTTSPQGEHAAPAKVDMAYEAALQAASGRDRREPVASPPEEVDLESYFETNPMPIEQAIELVYAATYALSYRI